MTGSSPSRPRLAIALSAVLLGACSSFPKVLDYEELSSQAMGRDMPYAVYTPPNWTIEERLPLVVFLHGGGDDEDCFDRHGVGSSLDAAMLDGEAPRCVICVPNGEFSFWENWHDGSYRWRDWVLDELVPEVQRTYNTRTGRDNLFVMGISMGGHGTLRFAHFEPERFGAIAAISAPVMDSEHLIQFADSWLLRLFVPVERIWGPLDDLDRIKQDDLFEQWQRQQDLGGVRVMIAHGSEDRGGIVTGCARFHEVLTERGIRHAYHVYPGGHLWVDWRPFFPMALRFLIDGDAGGERVGG